MFWQKSSEACSPQKGRGQQQTKRTQRRYSRLGRNLRIRRLSPVTRGGAPCYLGSGLPKPPLERCETQRRGGNSAFSATLSLCLCQPPEVRGQRSGTLVRAVTPVLHGKLRVLANLPCKLLSPKRAPEFSQGLLLSVNTSMRSLILSEYYSGLMSTSTGWCHVGPSGSASGLIS